MKRHLKEPGRPPSQTVIYAGIIGLSHLLTDKNSFLVELLATLKQSREIGAPAPINARQFKKLESRAKRLLETLQEVRDR